MSHLKERQQKNCLNCNAQVHGKYCHICGQENVEPAESLWHLITHFFNDITHFDGKFFSTLKLLVFKPGFLSAEYKQGRRHNYLNPVRMYVFTSFAFFLLFFSMVKVDEAMFINRSSTNVLRAIAEEDNEATLAIYKTVDSTDAHSFKEISRALNNGWSLSKEAFKHRIDSFQNVDNRNNSRSPLQVMARMDSARYDATAQVVADMDSSTFRSFTKIINGGAPMSRQSFAFYMDSARQSGTTVFGKYYKSRAHYDSLQAAGAQKHGWLKRLIAHRTFEIRDKMRADDGKIMRNIFDIMLHYFPQMLFLSLPLFAFVLKLLYYRHKEFYFVAHGIYSIHLYIFYFIGLAAMLLVNKLSDVFNTGMVGVSILIIFLILSIYEYKAMRNYYGQGRAVTILKFLLAGWARFTIIFILFTFFLLFSFLKI
ncbi:MAG: DUF3667 domain-containing protein [Chitinophagaceae bacterium]|nr:MAG: DUF3667 domain-containing protein [Chitinophagaceae bacterium]